MLYFSQYSQTFNNNKLIKISNDIFTLLGSHNTSFHFDIITRQKANTFPKVNSNVQFANYILPFIFLYILCSFLFKRHVIFIYFPSTDAIGLPLVTRDIRMGNQLIQYLYLYIYSYNIKYLLKILHLYSFFKHISLIPKHIFRNNLLMLTFFIITCHS